MDFDSADSIEISIGKTVDDIKIWRKVTIE
jgi:hypothetical protein